MIRAATSILTTLILVCSVGLPQACGDAPAVAGTLPSIPRGLSDFEFIDQRGNVDRPIHVWAYRPEQFDEESAILFVMHGTLRNGETYRKPWVKLADRWGCLVLVPEFSSEHYPGSNMYHFGNMRDRRGEPVEREKWTFSAVEHLFDHVVEAVGSRRKGYCMFGHSAGGQFVHRLMLMHDQPRAEAAIAANAGSYTMPTLDIEFAYGLGGIDATDEVLRAALSRPLIICLGEEDTDPNDSYLPRAPQAQAQGPHRLARGEKFFETASWEAERLGVDLKWRLVKVPGIGHDNAGMAPAAAKVLFE